MAEWQKFFLVRLPIAVVAVAMAAQGAASLLSGVTLHRHNVDDLANAVERDAHPYRVVLLGDSVTHNVAHKYRIGEADEVADLTTHAYAGLPSSLFLLKRYLESGHRPQYVVLAASRDVFVTPMDKSMFTYYVTSVFKQPFERDFLKKNYPDYVDYSWRPAALSMTTSLGEPLFSLIRHPGNDIWAAPESPPAHPQLEHFPDAAEDAAVFQNKLNTPPTVRPEVKAILAEMCQLSRQYQFELHIVWAPMETRLRNRLVAKGDLQRINAQLAEVFQENQTRVAIDDSAAQHDYPYFDRGLMHIKGLGWEQAYAAQLTSYIHQFERPASAPVTARQ